MKPTNILLNSEKKVDETKTHTHTNIEELEKEPRAFQALNILVIIVLSKCNFSR